MTRNRPFPVSPVPDSDDESVLSSVSLICARRSRNSPAERYRGIQSERRIGASARKNYRNSRCFLDHAPSAGLCITTVPSSASDCIYVTVPIPSPCMPQCAFSIITRYIPITLGTCTVLRSSVCVFRSTLTWRVNYITRVYMRARQAVSVLLHIHASTVSLYSDTTLYVRVSFSMSSPASSTAFR